MREWRKLHPLTPEQTIKGNCRSYAGVYLRRGKIQKPDECSCCKDAPVEQMHHEDYGKPLEITWLCRDCHRELHVERLRMKPHRMTKVEMV